MGTAPFEIPPGLRRGAHGDPEAWLSSGRHLLGLMAELAGRPRLDGVAVLDVGCGTKLTKVLLDDSWPIGRYVGVDVAPPVIEFLRANVADPRFAYHHLHARNDLYHPAGPPLAEVASLGIGDEHFDLVTLFSVFTHLPPGDYAPMLRLLRPYAKPTGRLVYSIFLDRPQAPTVPDDPEDLRRMATHLAARLTSPDPQVREPVVRGLAAWARSGEPRLAEQGERLRRCLAEVDPQAAASWAAILAAPDPAPDYYERVPDRPLLQSVYGERYARSLVEGTGWTVVEVRPPVGGWIQHHFVCRPT